MKDRMSGFFHILVHNLSVFGFFCEKFNPPRPLETQVFEVVGVC